MNSKKKKHAKGQQKKGPCKRKEPNTFISNHLTESLRGSTSAGPVAEFNKRYKTVGISFTVYNVEILNYAILRG